MDTVHLKFETEILTQPGANVMQLFTAISYDFS
jgi:hypothetical protein